MKYKEQGTTISKLLSLFEKISPIFINPNKTSITIGVSKRFLLFQIMKSLIQKIEDDPYINFISLLKYYKVLGNFLHGTIYELHRDRNSAYFKNFFLNKKLYAIVKKDIEWVYSQNQNLKLTITKRGVIIYDNYKKDNFNILLLTIHSGTWMPSSIDKKHALIESERYLEEDTDTHKIYSKLFLKNSGIWIDNKQSRFACDYNRSETKAIYTDKSETWINKVWKKQLTTAQIKKLMEGYEEFYFSLNRIIEAYRFNIIFDGHSMRDEPNRPEISFGTEYIPKFYMPVIRRMQEKMRDLGYKKTELNNPYSGGNILKWLNKAFPNIFICSMEINKKLYMNPAHKKSINKQITKLSNDLSFIFDLD